MKKSFTCGVIVLLAAFWMVNARAAKAALLEADLLIVGGGESAVAAAIQAARMGQQRIVLVNDIAWLGGEFSAEAVGAIDEWTVYKGKRTNFPRSGLFLEVLEKVRAYNLKKYGLTNPGNAFCASETIEPVAAAQIFEELITPYKSQIQIIRHHQPIQVEVTNKKIRSVTFEKTDNPREQLTVRAKLTIDASEWGDVIRLSGAAYAAGVDLKSRFNEEDAPIGPLAPAARNEMNPISYCLVIRETGKDSTIPRPPHYDERAYLGTTGVTTTEFEKLGWPQKVWRNRGPAFVDTAHPEGIYGGTSNPYTHRRLVDRWHNDLPKGTEKILLNWPTQDYPLYDFPKRVADALEATERGASKKNIVDMTHTQRRIVFEDAKQHALGMLYYLQTIAHNKAVAGAGDFPQSFKYFELTDEFGTPDRLPFKPYIREGLRLEALYMLREQDIKQKKNADGTYPDPTWAQVMVPDNVLGFQFNIDFHPTQRVFLNDDTSGPWMNVQTANRNWSTHTDCAGFPLRGLVPVQMNGLLGAGKNIGYSSIVSSALRLHGQMMHVGQAAGAAAIIALREGIEPRDIARDPKRIRELQRALVTPKQAGYGVLLWPYFDLKVDDRHFEAANMLAVRQILPGDAGAQDFKAWQPVTRREMARAVARAVVSVQLNRHYQFAQASFADVMTTDPDFPYIESLVQWGALAGSGNFNPDGATNWVELYALLDKLGLKPSPGLLAGAGRTQGAKLPLVRHELAYHIWAAIKSLPERFPDTTNYLSLGHDADNDGLVDLDDPLPFDRDNDNLPDWLDPFP